MKQSDIYIRTQKGIDSIRTDESLTSKHRMLFIMIDGKQTVEGLLRDSDKLGFDIKTLERLAELGYIQSITGEEYVESPTTATFNEFQRYYDAQNFMRETMADAAGMTSYFFMLKLEGAVDLKNLKKLLPDYEKTIRKKLGDTTGAMIMTHLNNLING